MEPTNDDLGTPPEVINVINEFSGDILLDPCSNPWSTVGAKVSWGLKLDPPTDSLEVDWLHWSVEYAEENGLDENQRLIFVNPPYGRGFLPQWSSKVISELFEAKDRIETLEMILLVPCSPDTIWYKELLRHSDAMCIWDKRIKFLTGKHGSGTFASTFFYFGHRKYLFAHHFSKHGDIRLRGM